MSQEPTNKAITGWRFKVYEVIFGYDTLAGKIFDVGLIITIIISLVVVMLESVAAYQMVFGDLFTCLEWILRYFLPWST